MSSNHKIRIAILTLQNSNNFGALLQAFALKSYLLKNFNSEVFIINHDWTKEPISLSKILKNPVSFYKKLKTYLSRKRMIVKSTKTNSLERFGNVFDCFRNDNLNITEKEYNYESLCLNPPEADVFIVGSDQVWAVDFLFNSKTYLLSFVKGGVKKISYAPSFGKANLESYLKHIVAESLSKFDSISVRENSGINIIKQLSDKPVTKVLDPTLLLTKKDYSSLIELPQEQNNYILVYLLDLEKSLFNWSKGIINSYADKFSMKVVFISTNNRNQIPEEWDQQFPSPGKFLGLIKGSHLVLTNSFHGTVFSIIYEKQFYALPRDASNDKQNLRITDLLKMINSSYRFIVPYSSNTEKKVSELDYQEIKEKLIVERLISKEFLTKAIKS